MQIQTCIAPNMEAHKSPDFERKHLRLAAAIVTVISDVVLHSCRVPDREWVPPSRVLQA